MEPRFPTRKFCRMMSYTNFYNPFLHPISFRAALSGCGLLGIYVRVSFLMPDIPFSWIRFSPCHPLWSRKPYRHPSTPVPASPVSDLIKIYLRHPDLHTSQNLSANAARFLTRIAPGDCKLHEMTIKFITSGQLQSDCLCDKLPTA